LNTADKTFKRFIIIWVGQLLSAVGSGLTAFALGVFVFQKTHSATSFSLIILFSFLPSFILLPFGGVLADRLDRKKMIIWGDMGAIIGLLFILLLMLSGNMESWQIYIGVAISSVFAAVRNPAYKAAVSDLVSEEFYSQASGLIQLAGSAQYLVSPIIAGFLISVFDIKLVLIIDIITFLVAALAVFIVKKQDAAPIKHKKHEFFAEMVDSFRYLLSQKGVLFLVLLTSAVCFFVGLLQALFGPMMLTLTSSKTLGIALSVMASGMFVSSLLVGIFGFRQNMVFILSLFLALAGLFYALIGLFTKVALIIIFGFLFFSALPFVNASLEVLIRKNINNKSQGRVWSFISIISQTGYILAFGSAGFLADNLFNPLFYPDGALVQTIGQIIGTGQGRGIGFIFILSGLLVSSLALIIGRDKKIRALDIKTVNPKQPILPTGQHPQPG